MRVCIYKGGSNIVRKSGVGQAIEHQKKALEECNVKVCSELGLESEVVHINTVLPDSVLAVWRAKKAGKKVVYYAHSTMEDFKKSFKGSNLLAPIFKKWIMFCYQLGDVIITPTQYSKKILEGYGLKKTIHVLSNGVDVELFKPKISRDIWKEYGEEEESKIIISVGHLMERKGILEYIELAKKMKDFEFFWFGDIKSPLIPGKISRAIKKAPRNLHFPGYIEQEKLAKLYAAADAFVFFSKEETEGIVVLEALASGTNVMLWDINAYKGWLEDGKNVYKVKSVEEAEEKLKAILEGKLPNLSKNGRQIAKERSLFQIGNKLIKIYSEEMNLV